MIDLTRTKNVLKECNELIEELHGVHLDDSDAVTSQSKGNVRQEKAKLANQLQLLATRFELAASITRIEYWWARGEADPLNPARKD